MHLVLRIKISIRTCSRGRQSRKNTVALDCLAVAVNMPTHERRVAHFLRPIAPRGHCNPFSPPKIDLPRRRAKERTELTALRILRARTYVPATKTVCEYTFIYRAIAHMSRASLEMTAISRAKWNRHTHQIVRSVPRRIFEVRICRIIEQKLCRGWMSHAINSSQQTTAHTFHSYCSNITGKACECC